MLRSSVKWALTLLLALLLALEIASVRYEIGWRQGRPGGKGGLEEHIWIGAGALRGTQRDWGRIPLPPGGFHIDRYDKHFFLGQWPGFCWFDASFNGPGGFSMGRGFRLPLTYPILALALPTAWLWLDDFRRRKKTRAGCCRACGYDLRGLEQANKQDQPHQPTRCPECGESPAPPGP